MRDFSRTFVYRRIFTALIASLFIFSLSLAYTSVHAETDACDITGVDSISDPQARRAELESRLDKCQAQIDEKEKIVEQYKKQGSSLKNEISGLNAQISKLNLQIKGINLSITNLSQEINETQKNINHTENKIDSNKEALADGLRALYESDKEHTFTILLAHDKLSDFFGSLNDILLMQEGVRAKLDDIKTLRQNLLEQKDQLAAEKEDTENLKAIQLAKKKGTESTQAKKATLLKETKGKESEYQKIVAKNKETAAQIRSRIFELLGGGELTFEKAYNLAKIAEGASGVRAALILAILNRESLLGKNVGQCTYQKAMHPTRDIPIFLDLTKRLGIDPTSVKVSCANQHGAYGGAMGPAQFIPSTWKLYESKIASATGNNPPNPWNNSDAFTATGVYIADLEKSSACVNYAKQDPSNSSKLKERCAAAMYYAGGSWYTYRYWYGEPVVTKADQYETDIAAIR